MASRILNLSLWGEVSRNSRSRISSKVVVGRKKSFRWRGLEEVMDWCHHLSTRWERRRVFVSILSRMRAKSSAVEKTAWIAGWVVDWRCAVLNASGKRAWSTAL